MGSAVVFALLLGVAAAWQLAARRRRLVDRCGRIRLAPLAGWRASWRGYLSGLADAGSCMLACGPSMLAMAAAPGAASMAVVLLAHLSEWAPGPNPFAGARSNRPAPTYVVLAAATLFTLR